MCYKSVQTFVKYHHFNLQKPAHQRHVSKSKCTKNKSQAEIFVQNSQFSDPSAGSIFVKLTKPRAVTVTGMISQDTYFISVRQKGRLSLVLNIDSNINIHDIDLIYLNHYLDQSRLVDSTVKKGTTVKVLLSLLPLHS